MNGVQTISLFQDSLGLVAASDHPLIARQGPLTIADITQGPLIIADITTAPVVRNTLCDLIRTPAFHAATNRAAVTVRNTHSLITLVGSGQWITVLPQTVAEFLREMVSLRPISDLHDQRHVFLYMRERARLQDLTRQCGAFIQSRDFTGLSRPGSLSRP